MERDPPAVRDHPAVDPVALAEPPVRADQVARADRRRPGRLAIRNPHLVALMRGGGQAPACADAPEPEAVDAADDLAAARGIALAGVLGALFWGTVIVLFRLLRRRLGL